LDGPLATARAARALRVAVAALPARQSAIRDPENNRE
jgi:hypothetical protein